MAKNTKVILALFFAFLGTSIALKCYHCVEKCPRVKGLQDCHSYQDACISKKYSYSDGKMHMYMGCGKEQDCELNREVNGEAKTIDYHPISPKNKSLDLLYWHDESGVRSYPKVDPYNNITVECCYKDLCNTELHIEKGTGQSVDKPTNRMDENNLFVEGTFNNEDSADFQSKDWYTRKTMLDDFTDGYTKKSTLADWNKESLNTKTTLGDWNKDNLKTTIGDWNKDNRNTKTTTEDWNEDNGNTKTTTEDWNNNRNTKTTTEDWNEDNGNAKTTTADWNKDNRNFKTTTGDWNENSRNIKTTTKGWHEDNRNSKTTTGDWNEEHQKTTTTLDWKQEEHTRNGKSYDHDGRSTTKTTQTSSSFGTPPTTTNESPDVTSRAMPTTKRRTNERKMHRKGSTLGTTEITENRPTIAPKTDLPNTQTTPKSENSTIPHNHTDYTTINPSRNTHSAAQSVKFSMYWRTFSQIFYIVFIVFFRKF